MAPRVFDYAIFEEDLEKLREAPYNALLVRWLDRTWIPEVKALITPSLWRELVVPGRQGLTGQVGVRRMLAKLHRLMENDSRQMRGEQVNEVISSADDMPKPQVVFQVANSFPKASPPPPAPAQPAHYNGQQHHPAAEELNNLMRGFQDVTRGEHLGPSADPNRLGYRSLGSTGEIGIRAALHYRTTPQRFRTGRAFS
ncbi:hypothetical protein JCM6882_004152 [Rhodosporidiobolus microsporus]